MTRGRPVGGLFLRWHSIRHLPLFPSAKPGRTASLKAFPQFFLARPDARSARLTHRSAPLSPAVLPPGGQTCYSWDEVIRMGVSGISISKIQLLALEKAAAESFAGSEGPYYRALLEKMLREFGGATAQKRHLPSGALLIRALCNAASKGGRALWSDAAVEFMHVNYGGRSGLSQLLSAAEKAAGEAWEMIGCECGCPLGYHVANACDPRIRATLEEKAA